MSGAVIAERYARALRLSDGNDIAAAKKQLEDLKGIVELFEIPQSAKVLLGLGYSKETKWELLGFAANKHSASEKVESFLKFVLEAKRIELLPNIVELYESFISEDEGYVNAEIVSAVELGDAEVAEIQKSVEAKVGKKLQLSKKVDASLLGGFKVLIGHKVIDLSIKKKLDTLTSNAVV